MSSAHFKLVRRAQRRKGKLIFQRWKTVCSWRITLVPIRSWLRKVCGITWSVIVLIARCWLKKILAQNESNSKRGNVSQETISQSQFWPSNKCTGGNFCIYCCINKIFGLIKGFDVCHVDLDWQVGQFAPELALSCTFRASVYIINYIFPYRQLYVTLKKTLKECSQGIFHYV